MLIATLTTDFGWQDFYVGRIKGALLSAYQPLQLVDITHHVEPYDIVRAAFILKNAYVSFPKGTLHLVCVNDHYQANNHFIAFEEEGQIFVGPDNGLFSMVFPTIKGPIHQLEVPQNDSFPLSEVLARAVAHFGQGGALPAIGPLKEQITRRFSLQPVTSADRIRGTVIHVDRYENVVVNIEQGLFEQIAEGRSFSLYFKRHDPILRLSKNYHEVPVGEVLCLFNASGLLEIAINMGKASSLLGLHLDDTVQVDFHDPRLS